MFKRQLDGHDDLLLQEAQCSEPVASRRSKTPHSLCSFPTTYSENHENGKGGDCCAAFREQVAMPGEKGELLFDRHFDFPGQDSLDERAAGIIAKHLSDTTKLVDETGYPGIGSTNHWSTCFYAAKD